MGFWDKIRGELIDIVEWLEEGRDVIVHRFERHGNEIKNGAKLVVREGQAAVFVNEGRLADVFEPGTYDLTTKNLPILSTIMGWKYGFESPFKAEVYFVCTRRFTDLKWGTKNAVMMRDPEFGPVRLRAFGTYAMQVADPATFLREIVGTEGRVGSEEVATQLRNILVARFSDVVGESRIPVLDLAANYDELGAFLTQRLADDMKAYGVDVLSLMVENISLPPAVEEALDKRTSMGVIGNLDAYTRFQAATAMEKAAQNPSGGGASEGIGLGMGFAMAQQMAGTMGGTARGATPPPVPGGGPLFHVAVDGAQTGPFDLATLKAKIAAGEVVATTLVWRDGMVAWQAAREVPELAASFRASPPPIPPQG